VRPAKALRLLATIAPLAVAATGCGGGEPPPQRGFEVGNAAPELEGTTAAGERFRLSAVDAPRLVLFYRGGYCGLCRLRLEALEEALPDYRALGVEVIGVSPEEPFDVAATASATGVSFPLVSVDESVVRRWGVRDGAEGAGASPVATYLVDRSGAIIYAHQGAVAADRTTDAALLTLLQQRR
jgi:peroxiredoxin